MVKVILFLIAPKNNRKKSYRVIFSFIVIEMLVFNPTQRFNRFSLNWGMDLTANHIEKLQKLCITYNVERMYLFGSALRNDFKPESDIDFLVKFKSINLASYFENYINFKEQLKKILGRDVDLVEEQALKNPILINSINKNKELIYG